MPPARATAISPPAARGGRRCEQRREHGEAEHDGQGATHARDATYGTGQSARPCRARAAAAARRCAGAARRRRRCALRLSSPRCPSCPRSRPSAAAWRRCSRGAGWRRCACSTSGSSAPLDPIEVADRLEGATVERLDRRGKYLLVRLVGGDVLVAHLRMTGNFLHVGDEVLEPQHLRAHATLDDGSTLLYTDIRRFGTWVVADEAGAARLPRRPPRPRAARRRLLVRRPGPRVREAARGGEGRAARSEGRRRRRQHLRRRGAAPRTRAPAGAGLPTSGARPSGASWRPCARCSRRGSTRRARRSATSRTPERRLRVHAGALPRLRAGRRAVRACGATHPAHRRRWARHALLPRCQRRPRASRSR